MMFNEFQRSNQVQETDSLAEDSVRHFYQEAQEHSANGHNNGYDFLIDEEYQQLKLQQEQLSVAKWRIMGEKASLNLILREIFTSAIDQTALLSKQQSGGRQQQQQYKHHPKYLSLKDLHLQIKSQQGLNNNMVIQLLESHAQIKKLYKDEQDKTLYLEQQLNMGRQQNENEGEREKYIEDLETQLQETRKVLLEKTLKLSDKEEEIQLLKRQIQNMDLNFQKLEEQKREIDQLVIKVSQELKIKEYDMRDFNYQLANDKDHLGRQVDLLKKELQEERDRKNALELLESDLIHKADVKESELVEMRGYVQELEEKVMMKGDAIEKAQKVIERLNEELDKFQNVLSQIEEERDQFKAENKELNRQVQDLTKQVTQIQNHHQMSQQHVSAQLKTEIDELKEALRQYQMQFDEEKRSLTLSLRDANEDKFKIHIDKEKQEAQYKKQMLSLQQQLEDNMKQSQERVKKLQKEMQEQKESLEQVIANREEQAHSQIKYLQKRLKEIANDQTTANNKQQQQNTGKPAYLSFIRQEFEKLTQETLEIRSLLKQQSLEKSFAIGGKINHFEEFKDKVMTMLEEWEVKSEGIAQLSERYSKELDEYKKLFMGMRQVLKEKDQLILSIQKQVKAKDITCDSYVQMVKKELENQTYLIKQDILDQFRVTQTSASQVNQENEYIDRRFSSFKQEYVQLLEDRDQFCNQNLKLKGEVEVLNRDIAKFNQEHLIFVDKVRVIVGASTSSEVQILQEIEAQMDELRVRKEEVFSYKSQLQTIQQQQEQDQKYLQQKIKAVEDQLLSIQRKNMSKEEEQQMIYLQKETKYINEIQKLQQEINSLGGQLSTRERQVKKLQEQQDEKEQLIEELDKQIDQSAREKEDLESMYHKTVDEMNQIQNNLENAQIEIETKVTEMQTLNEQLRKQEERQKFLKDSLLDRELELQREREICLQIQDEKYMLLSQYEQARDQNKCLEQETSNLYKELLNQKETVRNISKAFDETERQKTELQKTCHEMNDVVAQVQQEIVESQKAIEQLSSALESAKRKLHKSKHLKAQIKTLKAKEQQLNEIIDQQRRQLNPVKSNVEVQTSDFGMQEFFFYQDEMVHYQRQFMIIQKEYEQLQESMRRQNLEINRLIDEKRDLEDLVDQQNQSIKQIRMNGGVGGGIVSFKENVNIVNSNSKQKKNDNELYSKILQEKENYIMRLEQEISDMRKELEQLKEKLISYEMGNITLDRSIGRANSQLQQSIYKPTLRVFKGNQTQNSLNISNLYNGTPTTNFNTLQVNHHGDYY